MMTSRPPDAAAAPAGRLRVLLLVEPELNRQLRFDPLGAQIHILQAGTGDETAVRDALGGGWDIVLCQSGLLPPAAQCLRRLAGAGDDDAPLFLFFDAARAAGSVGVRHTVPRPRPRPPCADADGCGRTSCGHVRQLLHFDRPTGLPNGAFLSEVVRRATSGPQLFEQLVLMVINIRRFSLVRQTLDREDSDLVLRMVGARLRRAVGHDGLVARLDGDQYAVLLLQQGPGIDPAEVADRINACLLPPFHVANDELFFAHRVGISMFPRDGRDFHRLEANAELAAETTGRQGRSGYSFYHPPMRDGVRNRISLEHVLCRAIRNDGFVLHYQPQYDIEAARVVGVEALLRLHPAAGGDYSPAEFVPVLEDAGLIVAVGEWVLRTACERNRQWQQAGYPPMRMAVNLSAVQFEESDLAATVERVLRETGLEPRYLELEITENVAMLEVSGVARTLEALRDLGVVLTIDDFGKGYSSLSYLLRFPVQRLKIDRSFVHAITAETAAPGRDGSGSEPLLGGMIAMARGIGVEVLAEGVETPAQAAFLSRLGCREMQGFLFSRPAPAEAVPHVFEQTSHRWLQERLAGGRR